MEITSAILNIPERILQIGSDKLPFEILSPSEIPELSAANLEEERENLAKEVTFTKKAIEWFGSLGKLNERMQQILEETSAGSVPSEF